MFQIKKYIPFRKNNNSKKESSYRNKRSAADKVTLIVMALALFFLISLIYYNVRPLNLVDIKVPVSTEKPSYRPGENVNGIFFGEVFYEGAVRISRDIFCAGYRGTILTDEGDRIFEGNSRPIKLEGDLRTIGKLPTDVPVGKNCVIQFVNVYEAKTPFGTRHEEVTYYTQNFLILSSEADNNQADLKNDVPATQKLFENDEPRQPAVDNTPTKTPKNNSSVKPPQSQNKNNAPSTPAEPIIIPPQACIVDVLFVKLICD